MHDAKIEIESRGRNVIPYVKPQSIVTIHGKNGVGKSMASLLLEISTGNFVFKNEESFNKLSGVIQECTIRFYIDGTLKYKVNLKPSLWRYNPNVNKIKDITLGSFFIEEKKTTFSEFKREMYIRTIRGDESLHQQILFFKDVFIAKINHKLDQLD